MPIRADPIVEAERRARQQLTTVLGDLRNARRAAGLSQHAVAGSAGWSRQLIGAFERGRIEPTPGQLARWGAIVGLDVSIRAFVTGSPLRDAGQLRLLERFREVIGPAWAWRTEVPVSAEPRDRRAFDAVLTRHPLRVGVEAITRLVDAQGQARAATLKQEASGVDRVVLVLADTRHNRDAARSAAPTLAPSFPLPGPMLLAAVRSGRLPPANAVVFV